jgi:hypothetical protein
VSHPHVLAIRDLVDSDGRLFLVMDYWPGGDLADRLARRGRLSTDELLLLCAQLCGALGAAHRAGVVHRDVKPSNVLCGAGPALDVRLCDFGLARASELSGLTTANAVLGTPEYMAPEVITDGHADPRSDVYSLGVVLYEALTAKLPFHGDSPYQLMRQHIDVEAPRVSALVPDAPAAIERAIARALAKDPLDRFATMEDFARALAGDAPPTALATARREPAGAGPARRVCQKCGGWLVEAAAACADCGDRILRLERQRGGVTVLVTGRAQLADKVDARTHVELYKLLDEVGGVAPAGRRRAPRFPFYVAHRLTLASAEALGRRLDALGLEGRIQPRPSWRADRMTTKIKQLTWRYLAGLGILSQSAAGFGHLLENARWLLLAVYGVFVTGAAATLAVTARKTTRPLLVDDGAGEAGDDSQRRLARALPSLESRQDRRLVARVLERLGQIAALGHAGAAADVGRHAADATGALAALEARRRESPLPAPDARGAVDELRREERAAVLLRAHLLRAASRLDDLALVATRANAAGAAADRAGIGAELAELSLAADAEDELRALLEGAR